MPMDVAALFAAAREVRQHAYAPYSGFPVGAALLDSTGIVHTGVNVENASLGLTTCAERSAVVGAISGGKRSFEAIAIAGPHDDVACMPCGSCRQILHEVAPELLIVVAGPDGEPRVLPLSQLLPAPFETTALRGRPGEGAE